MLCDEDDFQDIFFQSVDVPIFEGGSVSLFELGIPSQSTEAVPKAQWICPEAYPDRSWRYLEASSEYMGSFPGPAVSKRAPRVAA